MSSDPRAELERLIQSHGDDYSALSRLVGRNPAYIQQFIKRGSPKNLPERERSILARYYGVEPQLLGAPEEVGGKSDNLKLVPKLAVGASAGAGALVLAAVPVGSTLAPLPPACRAAIRSVSALIASALPAPNWRTASS